MVKQPNKAEDEPANLFWSWRPVSLWNPLKGLGTTLTENRLLEQIVTTADVSDYLWYMTSVNLDNAESKTLRVNSTGHILHAFVNGKLVGSQYAKNGAFNFLFEQAVDLHAGDNQISLLSVTVGLKVWTLHVFLLI